MLAEDKMADNPVLLGPLQPIFRQPRQYLPRINHLEIFNDKKVFKRYRFSKETIILICDLVREDLERQTRRCHALPVEIQVLIALRFFATGAFLEVIGDTSGMDKGTVYIV